MTHISFTLNMDVTLIGMKAHTIETNGITKRLTINTMINWNHDLRTDSHVSDALRYASIELWTENPQLLDTSTLPQFSSRPQNHQKKPAVIDNQNLT